MMIKKTAYFLDILIPLQLFNDCLSAYERENTEVSTLLLFTNLRICIVRVIKNVWFLAFISFFFNFCLI